MTTRRSGRRVRSGKIVVLAALLLVPMLGITAFAVDLGYAINVRTDLQSVADAAALAGAQELMEPFGLWVPNTNAGSRTSIRTNASNAARTKAKTYATYNRAGNVNVTLLDSDVQLGFLDQNGAFQTNPPATRFPNTVRVTSRRDRYANAPVNLFFARVIGTNQSELTAVAQATIYSANLVGFRNVGRNIRLLPVAYDVVDWQNFLATGQDPKGTASVAANGTPQLVIYPSISSAGNFGELALDDEHAGSSEIRTWIDNGIPFSGISTLQSRGLVPTNLHNPNVWDWSGNPGVKSTTVQAVNDHVGERYYLPLFKAKNRGLLSLLGDLIGYLPGVGTGSSFDYNIVGFVGITIMDGPKSVITIQPTSMVDPDMMFDFSTMVPAGSGPATFSTTTLTYPRLSD